MNKPTPKRARQPQSIHWDAWCDVGIAGAGGAGLMAAIQAADSGARSVTVFYCGRTPMESATGLCGGLFTAAGTAIQKSQGVADSAEAFAQDVLAYGGYMANLPALRTFAASSGKAFDWLADRGLAPFRLEPYPGHRNLRAIRQLSYSGRDYLDVLTREAARRPAIHFLPEHALAGIVYDPRANRVLGVRIRDRDGQETGLRCDSGFIMATGGYSGSSEAIDRWVPKLRGLGVCLGGPHNDGEALRIAFRDCGVPLAQMEYIASYPWGVVTEGRSGVACRYMYFVGEGAILVNSAGKRFCNEEIGMTKVSTYLPKQPDHCHFVLMDATTWNAAMDKYGAETLYAMPSWSQEEVDAELARGRVLFRAETLQALAQKAGIDPEELAQTVDQWNHAVDDQRDPDFGRTHFRRLLANGPWYATRMTYWTNLTCGGVQVNDRFQVLNWAGEPIRGFFAAGETVAAIHGALYCGGNACSFAHTSGFVCGQNTQKEL